MSNAFYADNEQRDYPFIYQPPPLPAGVAMLPTTAICDFGAIMDIDAGYYEDIDSVYLYRLALAEGVFTYEFRTTAPNALDESLTFVRSVADTEYSIEWASSVIIGSRGVSSISPDACVPTSKWRGFLVTGVFTDLLTLIPDNTEIVFGDTAWVVEPGRIQSLRQGYARSINLANTGRTHALPGGTCASISAGLLGLSLYVNKKCMQGPLQVKPGYNCDIRQDDGSNSLTISAAVGAGQGQPCDEIPIYPHEVPPPNSQFLSGGPACNQIVTSINGVQGPSVPVIAGPGIQVTTTAGDPHQLVITANTANFSACTLGN